MAANSTMPAWGREIVARHEAGHAVTAIMLGWSVRYITLRPRTSAAAHTVTSTPCQWSRLDAGTIGLAGMAAEHAVLNDRRLMIQGALDDLRWTRNLARQVVAYRARTGEPAIVDADWSEWDVGAWMWRRARDMVTQCRPAIEMISARLCASSCAVPGSWIRHVVANWPRCDEPAEPDEWWVPAHSRLRWRKVLDAPR